MNKNVRATGVRWIGRGLAALLLAFQMFFMVASTGGAIWKPFLSEPVLSVYLLLMMAGLAVGLRYELAGALMTVGGYLAFKIYDGAHFGLDFFIIPLIPAAFFLLSWALHVGRGSQPDRRDRSERADQSR